MPYRAEGSEYFPDKVTSRSLIPNKEKTPGITQEHDRGGSGIESVTLSMSDFVSNADTFSERVPGSTVRTFGAEIRETPDGRLIWDNSGFRAKFDYYGDNILRPYDEHVPNDPAKLIGRMLKHGHYKELLRIAIPGLVAGKRSRATKEKIMENIQRLGLSDIYDLDEKGIEILRPELFKRGVNLQDIFRADQIPDNTIDDIDRYQALAKASEYIRMVHDTSDGGIGELVSNDIIFEDGKIDKPFLNIPDICWNEKTTTSAKEQKALDLTEFIISMVVEEARRSKGEVNNLKEVIDTVLNNYGDVAVVKLMVSLIKRGRFVLAGDKDLSGYESGMAESELPDLPNGIATKGRKIMTQHNRARLNIEKEKAVFIKTLILDRSTAYIAEKAKTDSN